jgi:hypothetical protein
VTLSFAAAGDFFAKGLRVVAGINAQFFPQMIATLFVLLKGGLVLLLMGEGPHQGLVDAFLKRVKGQQFASNRGGPVEIFLPFVMAQQPRQPRHREFRNPAALVRYPFIKKPFVDIKSACELASNKLGRVRECGHV